MHEHLERRHALARHGGEPYRLPLSEGQKAADRAKAIKDGTYDHDANLSVNEMNVEQLLRRRHQRDRWTQ